MHFLRFGEVVISKRQIKKIVKVEKAGFDCNHYVKLIDLDNNEYLISCISHETKCQIFEEISNELIPKDSYITIPIYKKIIEAGLNKKEGESPLK